MAHMTDRPAPVNQDGQLRIVPAMKGLFFVTIMEHGIIPSRSVSVMRGGMERPAIAKMPGRPVETKVHGLELPVNVMIRVLHVLWSRASLRFYSLADKQDYSNILNPPLTKGDKNAILRDKGVFDVF